eukprot:scaffold52617_cov23-Cyclotella_meneghiniana.AAC.1
MSNNNVPTVDVIREVLTGSASDSINEAEAAFRRKAWLALAPLYEVPQNEEEAPKKADEEDVTHSHVSEETVLVLHDFDETSIDYDGKAN